MTKQDDSTPVPTANAAEPKGKKVNPNLTEPAELSDKDLGSVSGGKPGYSYACTGGGVPVIPAKSPP